MKKDLTAPEDQIYLNIDDLECEEFQVLHIIHEVEEGELINNHHVKIIVASINEE